MKPRQKKTLALAGGIALLLLAMQRKKGKGTVLLGPVTVTQKQVHFDAPTERAIQSYTMGLVQSRKLMGADPNTFASRQPSASEQTYIEQTLAAGRTLSYATKGAITLPSIEEQRLTLAKKLPGDTLQKTNAEFYALFGINPADMNEPTLALTAAKDAQARTLIARWRPYSQDAVDTLFVLLDEARELAGEATV
jgi:hypothetical protein